mmetsp:Transcript_26528/g.70977  ORF Transcript_26528/g.70977 Transcript_26528/m.70977 type:complete len:653 (+) Transcript_26528:96-2054(+)
MQRFLQAFCSLNLAVIGRGARMQQAIQGNLEFSHASGPEVRTGLLRLAAQPQKCLNVIAGWAGNGNGIQLWDCIEGSLDEMFSYTVGGVGEIRWAAHPEKCLNVQNGADHWGTRIQIWDCMDDPSFKFEVAQAGAVLPIKWAGGSWDSCLNVNSEGKLQLHGCWENNAFLPQGADVPPGPPPATPRPTFEPPQRGGLGRPLPALSPHGASMAFVHLFEWKWDDVAKECEDFLGPKGFTAVQVSPPNEHMSGGEWWTRYQPVSYKLSSRSGDEAAFTSMVQRCKAVGVGIYADAVINHMASGSGIGSAGSHYGNRDFPGTYSPSDFHHDHGNAYRNCGVHDYNNKHEVQYCDLVGLPDLCTSCSHVQDQIAKYINHMAELGVAGFRVDAAKHIDAGELRGILSKVDDRLYRFLEVIGHGHEAVTPNMYYDMGAVTEFNYAIKVSDIFRSPGKLQFLEGFGEAWGLNPTHTAVTFIDNHDTQRGHAGEAALTHKSGGAYFLATIFMLAHPYGYPKIMSSYHFDNTDFGPPAQPVHGQGEPNCGHGKPWTCEHRWPAFANMVAWRKSAGPDWVSSFSKHGADRISFCRGPAACIAINREGSHWDVTLTVSVPSGEYCNIIKSDGSDCERVHVQDGTARVRVDPMSAVAFHTGARL